MKLSLTALALLATTTLALPSSKSRLEARVARRAASNRSTTPLNRLTSADTSDEPTKTHEEYSGNWAGVVIENPPAAATFTAVSATITVPNPSSTGGSDTQAASAWVGIDGDTCQNAILQTGVDFTVDGSGGVSFDSWYEWYPDYAYDFSGISYSPGDVVVLTVVSSSSTSGTAYIDNQSTGQQVSQDITSSSSLCGTNAEWIVEDFEEGGGQVPFANFGTVVFSGATASLSDGSTAGPSSGSLIDIQQNGQVLTTSSDDGSSVTVSYTG